MRMLENIEVCRMLASGFEKENVQKPGMPVPENTGDMLPAEKNVVLEQDFG